MRSLIRHPGRARRLAVIELVKMERRGSTRQGRVLVPAPLRIDDLGDSDVVLVDTPHDKVPPRTPRRAHAQLPRDLGGDDQARGASTRVDQTFKSEKLRFRGQMRELAAQPHAMPSWRHRYLQFRRSARATEHQLDGESNPRAALDCAVICSSPQLGVVAAVREISNGI
jgi:hypothetical protein